MSPHPHFSGRRRTHGLPALALLAVAMLFPARGAEARLAGAGEPDGDLTELSLEQLMDLEITVASRSKAPLRDAPAAVYVLTGDEIRRAGHTSVQEALRMVPGFHVAQWKTFGWDVTARGFTGSLSAINESFANQLLLMVDGVSYYNPVFAGMWWPLIDIPMADIERIEIIRGPAGTLWGANAVNGVVHVITKHSRDTLGRSFSARGDGWEQSGDLRQGGQLGQQGTYRSWLSYSHYDSLQPSTGREKPEDWWIGSLGYRADWDLGGHRFKLFGTAHTSQFGEELWDASVVGYAPWDETIKNGATLAGSYETGEPDDLHRVQAWLISDFQKQFDFQQEARSFDLEYTRARRIGERQMLNFGLGYRRIESELHGNNGYVDFVPEIRFQDALRGFVQDQIEFADLSSSLVLGTQVELSTLAGLEVQPNVRWLWTPDDDQTVWAAVSRAVRTPSLEEVDIEQRFDVNDVPFKRGSDDFHSEELLAYELGYRRSLGTKAFLDLATFINRFDELQSIELDGNGVAFYDNQVEADAWGVEAALDFDPSSDWRVRTSYSFFEMDFEAEEGSFENVGDFVDTKDELVPRHRIALRSYYDLAEDWELDTGIYWTDEHSAYFFDNPAYWRLDARLGWRPSEKLEYSVGVQNAQRREHPEAGEDIYWYGSLVERLVYASLRISI
jgi:iron complex outermembrane receptor protein